MSVAPRRRRSQPRVSPETRRAQLVAIAARLLTEHGIEQLHVTALASHARVSRPLVYRMFPTRAALLRALLEDFASDVGARFQRALIASLPGSIEAITAAFVEASCDAIAEKGAGPWLLLDARAADPELHRIGREVFASLLGPWQKRLATFTGAPPRRAANQLWIIVAAGRAALGGWIDGAVSRADAVRDAVRAVSALLATFAAR